MPTDDDVEMVYKSTLKNEYGFTDKYIRILGEPDKQVPNPHYRSGSPASLYSVDRVNRFLKKHRRAISQSKKRRSPKEMQRARNARFRRRYGSRKKALPDAAKAMFNLNRYAKHNSCTSDHRDEIYALKSEFIRLFFESGLAQMVFTHEIKRSGLRCHACARC